MSANKANEYYRQGLTALDSLSHDSAVDWFSRVRRTRRGRLSEAELGVGMARRAQDQADQVLPLQAIELDNDHLKAYTARAKAHEALGQLRNALTDAREVVRLSPQSHKVRTAQAPSLRPRT